MSLNRDRFGALLMLAFSVAYGALAFQIPLLPFQRTAAFTAQTMPFALSVLGILLSLALLIRPGSGEGAPSVAGFRWGLGALLCVYMYVYALTVRPAGFIIATSVFLIVCMVTLGERRWLLILGSSIPIVVAFWALMALVLDVYVAPWPNL